MTKLILRLERLAEPAWPSATRDADERRPHVVDLGDERRRAVASTPLARWISAVAGAHEPCFVLDGDGQVLSLSAGAAELLGCADPGAVGRRLLDVVEVVDFDYGGAADYATRIAPLAVLTRGSGLMRSLMRVRQRDGVRVTLDTSSAPIHDADGATVGSCTFLAPVHG